MGDRNDRPRLVIVDDEVNFGESLRIALEDAYEVAVVPSVEEATRTFREALPEIVLIDMRLPDGDGLDVLRALKQLGEMPIAVVMTAYATVENAVRALKEGAVDYFVKPFEIDRLRRELSVHLENRSLHRKLAAMDREMKLINPPFLASDSGRMGEIVAKAPMIAPLDIPVLIRGETGTGKEKLAKWIHSLSGLKGGMVAINCAALPKDLMESEFFGHARGAFSGAASHKEGFIERAEGGTLLLDEIGELPDGVQAKLLRVLEDGVYYRLGDPKEHRARFRLISATNKDLADLATAFRQDLFFRINGVVFDIPPLRERLGDIPMFVSAFLKEANHAYRKNVGAVSARTMERLKSYSWPGNIRELKWAVHRAVAVATSGTVEIDESFLRAADARGNAARDPVDLATPFEEAMEGLEKRYIENALRETENNKTEAARLLGISVRVLHYKIRKYRL